MNINIDVFVINNVLRSEKRKFWENGSLGSDLGTAPKGLRNVKTALFGAVGRRIGISELGITQNTFVWLITSMNSHVLG